MNLPRRCRNCPIRLDWWAIRVVAREHIHMGLSPAERREVVRLNVNKMTGEQLGELLGVSRRTVERYKEEMAL